MADSRSLEIKSEPDAYGGSRTVWLREREGGGVSLEGQDLGGAVSGFWGSEIGEYEWAWSLEPDGLETLLTRLGIDADVPDRLQEVRERLQSVDTTEAEQLFKEAGATFWSRVGD